MFDPAEYDRPVKGPWAAHCGDPGPYCMKAPTPKSPNRLVILDCNRPRHHKGDHAHYTSEAKIVAKWGRDGQPIQPLPNL